MSADSAQGADTPIAIRARADYYRATNKRAEGLPIEIYFDPQRGGPEAYLYPEPEDVGVKIHTISVYQYDDMDTDDDDLACTESWYLVVVLGLARRISNKVGVNKKRRATERRLHLSTFQRVMRSAVVNVSATSNRTTH
jgi:hypothetical protein